MYRFEITRIRWMTLAAAVLMALTIAACSGSSDPVTTSTTPAEVEESGEADGAVATEAVATEPPAAETTQETEAAEGTATPQEAETTSVELPQVDFVIPYDPGGGYDQYVRIIAPYLSECLGTDVIPRNEPGAGSLLATTSTGVGPTDGSRIQIFNTVGAISAQLAEAEGANFDLSEYTWIGRIADEPSVVSVASDSEFETFQDLIDADRTLRFVATGPGSNEFIFANVLSQVFGFDIEVITGFAGSGEAQTSVIQGDADAQVLSVGSSLGPINAGDMRPLALVGANPHPLLPDTPTVYDFEPPEDQMEILDALVGLVDTARSVAGPPGMDQDVTEALREGLRCALENDEFLAQAEAQERDISFLAGADTQSLIEQVLNAPAELQALIKESF